MCLSSAPAAALMTHLVKDLYSPVHHVQLEELLRQVLQPEVDRPGRQEAQERDRRPKHRHAEHIEELVAMQGPPATVEGTQR